MTDLNENKCLPCEGGVRPLSLLEAQKFLTQVKSWQLSEDNQAIYRDFEFKNFYQTMAFVNAVAWIANQENHHPDMEVGYKHCMLRYTTHAIGGLSRNDFICAAKVNLLI